MNHLLFRDFISDFLGSSSKRTSFFCSVVGIGTFVSYFTACVILTETISGLTPSERNSLNRDRHDFCVNVKTLLELFVTCEKPNIFT